MCQFLYLKDPLNFWDEVSFISPSLLCYCHGDSFRCLLTHGCCGDHQTRLSAFQGTNTFSSDQPVLVLALALGLHVPLLQCALWVVTLEDAMQLKPLMFRREGRVFSSHSPSQNKLHRLDRVPLP